MPELTGDISVQNPGYHYLKCGSRSKKKKKKHVRRGGDRKKSRSAGLTSQKPQKRGTILKRLRKLTMDPRLYSGYL